MVTLTSQPQWIQWMEQRLPEYGIASRPAQLQRWAEYLSLLEHWNQRIRLIGDREVRTWIDRHLGESLAVTQWLSVSGKSLADIGSGAGFPGLCLALGYPIDTTLVEIKAKKAAFLREAIANAKKSWEPASRISVLEINAQLEGQPHDIVTVRALEEMIELPRWVGHWLKPNGTLAAWISSELAEQWKLQFTGWKWSKFHPLPYTRHRGILLGNMI